MECINRKKSFIMLQEQNRNFALDKKQPIKGYLKLQTGGSRGSIRAGVENLRCFERGSYIYKLIFFGKKNERTIYSIIGNLLVSTGGKGETYFRINPLDMDGNGHGLSSFTIAIIVAVSTTNYREPLHPVLEGAVEMQETRRCRNGCGTFNHYYNQHILACCRAIENKKELYNRTVPFKEDKLEADWRRVVNLSAFPIVSPGSQRMISRYRHFIFGTTETFYYIGVPGRYLENEQPEGGNSGFVLWQPIQGAEVYCADREEASLENRQIAYGYWIAGIRRENGDIEDLRNSGQQEKQRQALQSD